MEAMKKPMRTIGIETSGSVGSVALLEDGLAVDERFFEKGLRHGKELVPSLDAMLRARGLQPAEIGLIAVSQGPGSYTGIRVGITVAKTLAYALGRPVVGVPSLDVLAQNAIGLDAPPAAKVHAALDAKRKRIYFASYRRENGRLARESECRALPLNEAVAAIQPGDLVIGDAIRLFAKEFAARGAILADDHLWRLRASAAAELGLLKFHASGGDDPFSLVPIYLHRPEAEEVWERKHKDNRPA